jgi:hypothetical protein
MACASNKSTGRLNIDIYIVEIDNQINITMFAELSC